MPLIALFGRSNAGKSSLINTLINRKNLARTSGAPGKTRLLNFYRISATNEAGAELAWFFVDLPGYGYAKVSKTERAHWLDFMDELLRCGRPLSCWQLVDIRHQPSREDIMIHDILTQTGFPLLTVANKIDKISKNARAKAKRDIAASLGVADDELILFSAVSREGREALLAKAEGFLASAESSI